MTETSRSAVGVGERVPVGEGLFVVAPARSDAEIPVDAGPIVVERDPIEMLGHPLDSPEFALRWPKDVFVREAQYLAGRDLREVELLLEDAFMDRLPIECLQELARARLKDQDEAGSELLRALTDHVDQLQVGSRYRPYYQARRRQAEEIADPNHWEPTSRELLPIDYTHLIDDLLSRGYFIRAFGEDCDYNGPSDISPTATIATGLGWTPAWPLDPNELKDDAKLFDIIERLHDLVARPRRRVTHEPDYTCFHHSLFAPAVGQALYRWEVNRLLDDADVGLRFADDGDDIGRLVSTTDQARTDLVHAMLARSDPATGDSVRHAISLFRTRAATRDDKRSACAALARVLEDRRALLKTEIFRGDEGALFQIANEFDLRHSNERQKVNYRPEFLDWVFWWYLATIELTDRLLAEQSGTTSA